MKIMVKLLLLVLLVLMLLLGTGGSRSAEASPTWQLVDYHQSSCFDTNVHDTYYGIYINGKWTHKINVGITHLPAGGTYDTSYAPIPPGSSNGQYSLAYVHPTIPATTPVGTYTANLWASDGTSWLRFSSSSVLKKPCTSQNHKELSSITPPSSMPLM